VSERGREEERERESVCGHYDREYRYDTLHRANIALSRANKKDRSGNSAFLLVVALLLRVHSTSTRAKKQHTLAGAVVEHLVPTNGISSSLDLCCVVLQQQRMETSC